MPDVTLIYDPDCPNVDAARRALGAALGELGLPETWHERNQAETPTREPFASPTILVGGRDVAGAADVAGRGCRLYVDDDGARAPAPPVSAIVRALRAALTDR